MKFFKQLLPKKQGKNTLVFNHDKESLYEVFGYTNTQIHEMAHAFLEFMVKDHEKDVHEKSKSFERFLASEEFKKFGMKLDNPNDWFVLGQMFAEALEHLEKAVPMPQALMEMLMKGGRLGAGKDGEGFPFGMDLSKKPTGKKRLN